MRYLARTFVPLCAVTGMMMLFQGCEGNINCPVSQTGNPVEMQVTATPSTVVVQPGE